jgi:hypothetical protein
MWNYTSILPYAFIVSCFTENKANSTAWGVSLEVSGYLTETHYRSFPLGCPATTSNFIISDPASNSILLTVLRRRRLVTVLSMRKPAFDPNPVCVGFIIDEVALRLGFPPPSPLDILCVIPPVLLSFFRCTKSP